MRRQDLSLVAIALVVGCPAPKPTVVTPTTWVKTADGGAKPIVAPLSGRPFVAIDAKADADGKMTVTLPGATTTNTSVVAIDLTSAETQALLARLEPLPAIDNSHAPVVRPPSAAPPRVGTTTPIAFVAPTGAAVTDKPVARPPLVPSPMVPPQILPDGEVHADLELRIRFDEPMVAVASVSDMAKPVARIEPPIDGNWRWIDTRVAGFFAKGPRFAQATTYKVTVPKGAHAVSGAILDDDTTGTFSTPPVAIERTFPRGYMRPDAPIAVIFDQDIDAAAIAKFLRVTTLKGAPLATKPIALDAARELWKHLPGFELDASVFAPKRVVIIAPAANAWPSGTTLRIALGKGAPSAEGPRLSTRESDAQVEIVPKFRVQGLDCGYRGEPKLETRCPQTSYLTVQFTTSIDPKSFRSRKVQIEGGGFQDSYSKDDMVGLFVPGPVGHRYTVKIASDITDRYGQPLEGPTQVAFTTTPQVYEEVFGADTGLYVLDPRFEIPQWVVSTQAIASLHIQLFAVQPADYFAWEQFEAGKRATPPGKRVYDKVYAVGARFEGTARVDLRPALDKTGVGHIIAIATGESVSKTTHSLDLRRTAWIEVTRLGVVSRVDGDKASAWVSDISPPHFLAPIANASASLLVDGRAQTATATTDAAGHAEFELPPRSAKTPADTEDAKSALLVVRSGTDSAFTSIDRHEKALRTRDARWYVTDDRFMYKPGEPVYMKGWVRWTQTGVNPKLELPPGADHLAYTLNDTRGNKLATGTVPFSDQGGFDFKVDIPANANLGTAYFTLTTNGQTIQHPIDIQEFRTPAYAVTLDDDAGFAGSVPLVLGESIEMTAEGKYYAGGGMAGAKVKWSAELQAATYRPPGWDPYAFTPAQPRDFVEKSATPRRRYAARTVANEAGQLSGASSSTAVFGIAALPNHEPSVLTVDATVTDLDRTTIRASSHPIVVHPASYYVGVRLKPETLDQLQLIVTDIEGNAVSGVPIDVTLEGVLDSERYRDDPEIKDTQKCALKSAAAPVVCAWKLKDPAHISYRAVAKIADTHGRANATTFDVPYWRTVEETGALAILPDRHSYKPGDVAKLTIQSKQVPATAVVSFARGGIIAQKRVELVKENTIVELPIEVAYIQNIHVVVDRWMTRRNISKASPLPLPEHSEAEIDLPVDVEAARLVMRARPTQPLVEPGADATFEVDVSRADKPVAHAEVALIVVDEAILSLSGKVHADPLAPFYSAIEQGTSVQQTLDLVHDADVDLLGKPGFERIDLGTIGTGSGYGAGYGAGGMASHMASVPSVSIGSAAVAKSRKDFRATAVFAPKLLTDEHGHATVTIKMPDSLTRFRVVALAASNTYYFGKAEGTIVTQRKINARTIAPRFLTQGDRFQVPVVVQNLDAKPRTIEVAMRAANLVATGAQGKRVTIPGGQRGEVRFDFATEARGKAVIQTIAATTGFVDASNVELPVYEPATTESFATYGVVDDKPKYERLDVPNDIFVDVGGIETEVASTQMQSLTDAYWYLYAYPYECSEQRSSRMLATSAMYEVLDAFDAPGRPTRKELAQIQATDAQKLISDQNSDGSWGYWRDTSTDAFVTMQVLTALAAQHQKGAVVTHAIDYVTKRFAAEVAIVQSAIKPTTKRTGAEAYAVSLAAAALASLAAAGVDERANAQRLHALAEQLAIYPVDAKARLLAIVAKFDRAKDMRAKLVAALLSATHETAASATVAASYQEAEKLLLVSNTRTSALVLDALIREVPEHAVIQKLARGVLDARVHGRWRSTQENLAVLQAMRRYFDTYEKDTPNYTGKLWVGNAAYAEQAFKGRSNLRAVSQLDWSALAPGSGHDITVDKTGPGRMYYRVGITYAPKRVDLPPLDAGFIVRRSYEAVDDPSDVTKTKDGWRIKLGARVRVVLEELSSAPRDQVAFVDPLPAGLEAVNTRLANAERAADGTTSDSWDHIAMRDNRAEAFASSLREGVHHFVYTARAITPGTFIAAPTKAEEMYSPETFGRSGGAIVVVY